MDKLHQDKVFIIAESDVADVVKAMQHARADWEKQKSVLPERDYMVLLFDAGKGSRMRKSLPPAALDEESTKGDICIFGQRLRDIVYRQIRYFTPFLPKGKWLIIRPADEVLFPTESDLQQIKADFEDQPNRGIYLIGWRNWQKKNGFWINLIGQILNRFLQSELWFIKESARVLFRIAAKLVKQFRQIDREHPYFIAIEESIFPYFEEFYSQTRPNGEPMFNMENEFAGNNLFLTIFRPSLIQSDWIWDFLFDKRGFYSREEWSYLRQAGKLLLRVANGLGILRYHGTYYNLNTVDDLKAFYRGFLPGITRSEARHEVRRDFQIPQNGEVLNSKITGNIQFEGFHLVYDSELKADKGVIVQVGSGTIIDRCKIRFRGKPGTEIIIESESLLVGIERETVSGERSLPKERFDKIDCPSPTLKRLKELRKEIRQQVGNRSLRLDFGELERNLYEFGEYLINPRFSKIADKFLKKDIALKIPLLPPLARLSFPGIKNGILELHVATFPMVMRYLDNLAEGFSRTTKGVLKPTDRAELLWQFVEAPLEDKSAIFDLRDRYHGYGFILLDKDQRVAGYYQGTPEKRIENINRDGVIKYAPVMAHYGQKAYLEKQFRGKLMMLGEFLFYLSVSVGKANGLTEIKARASNKTENENVILWHQRRYQQEKDVGAFKEFSGSLDYALQQCEQRMVKLDNRLIIASEALLNFAIRRAFTVTIKTQPAEKLLEMPIKEFDSLIRKNLSGSLCQRSHEDQIKDEIAYFQQMKKALSVNKPVKYISPDKNEESVRKIWHRLISQPSDLRIYFLDRNVFVETDTEFIPLKTRQIGTNVMNYLIDQGAWGLYLAKENDPNNEFTKENFEKLFRMAQRDYVDEFQNTLRRLYPSVKPLSVDLLQEQLKQKVNWQNNKSVVVAIHQPGYLRYRGFYHKMAHCDIFVLYDCVQYVDREWQNRGYIFDPSAFNERKLVQWLTVPLKKGHRNDTIAEKIIAFDQDWQTKHLNKIKEIYADSPYFEHHQAFLETFYDLSWTSLAQMTEALIRYEAKLLGIHVPMMRSSFLTIDRRAKKGKRLSLVIQKVLGKKIMEDANIQKIYLSGKGALEYLDNISSDGKQEKEHILEKGIDIMYQHFVPFSYARTQDDNGDVHPGTATLDMLVNQGSNTIEFLAHE